MQLDSSGTKNANWSTSSGRHRMVVREAVLTLPGTLKPEVVTAQIHDAADDVVMVRAEKNVTTGVIRLRASYPLAGGGNGTIPMLDSYTLGTPFTVEIVAEGGVVHVSLDGAEKGQFMRATTGCYFKAGCYTQSNVKDVGEKADAYGEVAVFSVRVEHS